MVAAAAEHRPHSSRNRNSGHYGGVAYGQPSRGQENLASWQYRGGGVNGQNRRQDGDTRTQSEAGILAPNGIGRIDYGEAYHTGEPGAGGDDRRI